MWFQHFLKRFFVSIDSPENQSNRYFEIDWHLEGDEVKLGIAREIEKQVKFFVKEIHEFL